MILSKAIMMTELLQLGATGPLVEQWQAFLRGQAHRLEITGRFDEATEAATIAFQKRHRLDADGIVGNQTFGRAAMLGFELVNLVDSGVLTYPPRPDFDPLSAAERERLFGRFAFVPEPTLRDPENIRITDGWEEANIVTVDLPHLRGIRTGGNGPSAGRARLHRRAASQVVALWDAWGRAGVTDWIVTWDGAFNARFMRGSTTSLSNHAFGTAFDVNARHNGLGKEPAPPGTAGCLYDLVALAHEHGLYWGGHFRPERRDGMHFEIAVPG